MIPGADAVCVVEGNMSKRANQRSMRPRRNWRRRSHSASAKEQLDLLLRQVYLHPSGQIPAYEWNFSDVNPPVQAWAAIFIYRMGAGAAW